MATSYRIESNDLTSEDVATLLDLHLAEMHRISPPCKVHAMPLDRLRQSGRPAEYAPAQNLYRKHGFAECADFGDYAADDFSICMSLAQSVAR